MHFFHFYSCSSNLFNFFVTFFNFLNGFENSMKFCVGHINTFFILWSQTRKKRRQKSKNVWSKCVLDLNFAPIKGYVFLIFFKKVKNRCTLMDSGHPGLPLSHLRNIYLFTYFGLFFSLLRKKKVNKSLLWA